VLPELTTRVLHGCVVVEVRGEVDLSSAHALDQCLSTVLAGEALAIVLDLSHMRFIDAAGLRVMLRAERQAAARGRSFVLAGLRPAVARLLVVTDFDRRFTIFPTVAEAAAAFPDGASPATRDSSGPGSAPEERGRHAGCDGDGRITP
jgi:anti-sigma B factor antagonist